MLERVGDESGTYCVSPACPAQQLQQMFVHFASRGAPSTSKASGEQRVAQLLSVGLVGDVAGPCSRCG